MNRRAFLGLVVGLVVAKPTVSCAAPYVRELPLVGPFGPGAICSNMAAGDVADLQVASANAARLFRQSLDLLCEQPARAWLTLHENHGD